MIQDLSADGIKLNVTAVLLEEQVANLAPALDNTTPSIVSLFAGRIADTGINPMPMIRTAKRILRDHASNAELLWASVREVYNIFQAEECRCDVVTVPISILEKAVERVGCDLGQLSLETVKMFSDDASAAGYTIPKIAEDFLSK